MAVDTNRRGPARDLILKYFETHAEGTPRQIVRFAQEQSAVVPASSIRSYLNLNTGDVFKRLGYGSYKLISGRK